MAYADQYLSKATQATLPKEPANSMGNLSVSSADKYLSPKTQSNLKTGGNQPGVDVGLATQLTARGATPQQIGSLSPQKVTAGQVAYDVLDKADTASTKTLNAIGKVVTLPFQAVQAVNKAVGAGMEYMSPLESEKGKSYSQLYQQDPGLSGRLADTLSQTTKALRERGIGKTQIVNVPGVGEVNLDEFMPEFIGQLGDVAEAGAILGPLGKRIATKTNTVNITPEQMFDTISGRTPKGAPLTAEQTRLLKEEILNPDTAKEVIDRAAREGVTFKTQAPAGAARQIAGELIGGKAQEAKTETLVGGKPIVSTEAPKTMAAQLALEMQNKPTQEKQPTMADALSSEVQKVQSDPLVAEAKKYGSAEEFVKAQTNAYHGGADVSKGVQFGKSKYDKTFFVSDSADYAKGYGGKDATMNGIHVKPDAKLIDIKNASPEEITAIKNKIQEIKDAHVPYSGKGGFNPTFGNSTQELLDGAIRGKSHFAEDAALIDVYKKLGYDGMISYEDAGMRGKNIGVWNKDKVLTKSQLTDIWNNANPPPTMAEQLKAQLEPAAPSSEETKPAKAALDINKSLVEKGFKALPESELAQYSTITKADQIEKVGNILASDVEGAKQMALGNTAVPEGVKSQVLYNAVKEYAKEHNDVQLMIDLAKSPIAEERSLAAQTLGSSGFNNGDSTDPVELIAEANKKLAKANEPKAAKAVAEETSKFRQAVKKARAPKQNWNSFIDSITC